jgi:hypothetical protein
MSGSTLESRNTGRTARCTHEIAHNSKKIDTGESALGEANRRDG